MSKKDNLSLGVQQEFADIDYWHKLPRNKFVTLKDGTKISVYEYMKKFMHESYANNFDRTNHDNNILQTEEQKVWARRNNNNTNRDALNVIKKSGKIATIFHLEETASNVETEAWEDVFKLSGYEAAAESLTKKICEELGISLTYKNQRNILKIYFRFAKFLKLLRSDIKHAQIRCKACGKNKYADMFADDKRTHNGKKKRCIECEMNQK